MARITASVYTSHVPAIGAALDLGKDHEPYWQKVFAGYEFGKRWLRENGISLVTGIMLGLAVLFGFKSWTEYGVRKSETASNLFVQFAGASTQNMEEAVKHYDALIKDFSGSEYAVLASLWMAKLQLGKGDAAAARAHVAAVAEGLDLIGLVALEMFLLPDGRGQRLLAS